MMEHDGVYVDGAKIRGFRTRMKLTQVELSWNVGCSEKTISAWETGARSPSFSTLNRLARALKVSVTDLLSEESTHREK